MFTCQHSESSSHYFSFSPLYRCPTAKYHILLSLLSAYLNLFHRAFTVISVLIQALAAHPPLIFLFFYSLYFCIFAVQLRAALKC